MNKSFSDHASDYEEGSIDKKEEALEKQLDLGDVNEKLNFEN